MRPYASTSLGIIGTLCWHNTTIIAYHSQTRRQGCGKLDAEENSCFQVISTLDRIPVL